MQSAFCRQAKNKVGQTKTREKGPPSSKGKIHSDRRVEASMCSSRSTSNQVRWNIQKQANLRQGGNGLPTSKKEHGDSHQPNQERRLSDKRGVHPHASKASTPTIPEPGFSHPPPPHPSIMVPTNDCEGTAEMSQLTMSQLTMSQDQGSYCTAAPASSQGSSRSSYMINPSNLKHFPLRQPSHSSSNTSVSKSSVSLGTAPRNTNTTTIAEVSNETPSGTAAQINGGTSSYGNPNPFDRVNTQAPLALSNPYHLSGFFTQAAPSVASVASVNNASINSHHSRKTQRSMILETAGLLKPRQPSTSSRTQVVHPFHSPWQQNGWNSYGSHPFLTGSPSANAQQGAFQLQEPTRVNETFAFGANQGFNQAATHGHLHGTYQAPFPVEQNNALRPAMEYDMPSIRMENRILAIVNGELKTWKESLQGQADAGKNKVSKILEEIETKLDAHAEDIETKQQELEKKLSEGLEQKHKVLFEEFEQKQKLKDSRALEEIRIAGRSVELSKQDLLSTIGEAKEDSLSIISRATQKAMSNLADAGVDFLQNLMPKIKSHVIEMVGASSAEADWSHRKTCNSKQLEAAPERRVFSSQTKPQSDSTEASKRRTSTRRSLKPEDRVQQSFSTHTTNVRATSVCGTKPVVQAGKQLRRSVDPSYERQSKKKRAKLSPMKSHDIAEVGTFSPKTPGALQDSPAKSVTPPSAKPKLGNMKENASPNISYIRPRTSPCATLSTKHFRKSKRSLNSVECSIHSIESKRSSTKKSRPAFKENEFVDTTGFL